MHVVHKFKLEKIKQTFRKEIMGIQKILSKAREALDVRILNS